MFGCSRRGRYCTAMTKAVVISHHRVYRHFPVIGHHRIYRPRPRVITELTGLGVTAGSAGGWGAGTALVTDGHHAYRYPGVVIMESTGLPNFHPSSPGLPGGACHHFRQLPLPLWSCHYSNLNLEETDSRIICLIVACVCGDQRRLYGKRLGRARFTYAEFRVR